jgi:teichuronic acid biosynthesis glycosyltransferase TuaC
LEPSTERKLHTLLLSQQFPCAPYPALAPFVGQLADALCEWTRVELLAPRPYLLPLPGVPFGKLATLPTIERGERYLIHRPHYWYLPPKRVFYPLAGRAYRRTSRSYAERLQSPDVVHAQWSYPDAWGGAALAAHFQVPLVVHARGTLERVISKQSSRHRRMIQRGLLAADRVIANSRALHDDCLELGVHPERISILPDGLNLERFTPRDKRAAKKQLGLEQNKKLILYCGNLQEVKGIRVLLRTLQALPLQELDAQFALVGAGPLEASLRAGLQPQLEAGQVRLIGARPHCEIPCWMNAADLLVLPSLSEARSNVIPEALACRTPVVASRVGGIPEIVKAEFGVLIEPNQPAELGRAISEMMGDDARRGEMGQRGYDFIRKSALSWREHARLTEGLYRELIAEAKAASAR